MSTLMLCRYVRVSELLNVNAITPLILGLYAPLIGVLCAAYAWTLCAAYECDLPLSYVHMWATYMTY